MNPTVKYLKDYQPSAFLISDVDLKFDLDLTATKVRSRMQVTRVRDGEALTLDGDGLSLVDIRVEGRPLSPSEYALAPGGLTLLKPPEKFELETLVEIDPSANSALTGLYVSAGRFCTQCESEGFRRITYYLDRPDVLARFHVRIEADAAEFPTLLSNGDCVSRGKLAGGRHYAEWDDPHPKPAYLFALVGGKFESIHDHFVTMSGKNVALSIYVDPGDGARARFAMGALKRSMRWDEEAFKREYDLGEFNIVAVRDFNYGAMENKGLNIFNSSALLADDATETDEDFFSVERIIAHEYFHNWTGDRITLRDWFQLCLKEGLTVFRDQEYMADQGSRTVQRIRDTENLRSLQFPEDAGPLAHPVRPRQFVKIENFYTPTVYRKGAEVIRVLQTLIGAKAFDAGIQLYFERHDGEAVTVEDFIACFAEASGKDLATFFRWYDQAGTPVVSVNRDYDEKTQTLSLTVTQTTPPTPNQPDKVPLPIPLRIGFVASNGEQLTGTMAGQTKPLAEHAVVLDEAHATFTFTGITREPITSVLRGASAPVVLNDGLDVAERLVQMRHDPDSFTRWDVGQRLLADALLAHAADERRNAPDLADIIAALGEELARASEDPAFTARALAVPDLSRLIQLSSAPDPDRLDEARRAGCRAISEALDAQLVAAATRSVGTEASHAPADVGWRALKVASLRLLAAQGDRHQDLLTRIFEGAGIMTIELAGLNALGAVGGDAFDRALKRFEMRWEEQPLVMDKWFAVQARLARDDAPARIRALTQHRLFTLKNPNRARAVFATFGAANLRQFHAADGSGYELLGDAVIAADPNNPNLAARFLRLFDTWKKFDAGRQAHAKAVLTRIKSAPGISDMQRELVDKLLA
jgi:aminopeptidase N